MSDGSDDEELGQLIERAQVGDPLAFERIVQALEQPLLGFARAQGAADPDATANEVLLRVFRGILVFEGAPPQFRAWVFRIARNLIIDERRSAGRRLDSVVTDPVRLIETPSQPDTAAIEEIDDVKHLLEDVPKDQRDVLILRIVAGLSVAEVADVLDKRPGAIRALQHRGLERLRKELSVEP